jgi:CheY-like chemotaxis protein
MATSVQNPQPAQINQTQRTYGLVKMASKHVLVADDNAAIRKAICELVTQDARFHPCSQVENGFEAVLFVKRQRPDLVIMDMSMPVMDGLEASTRITREFPHVVVVLVSMHSDLMSDADLRRYGISARISKEQAAKELMPLLTSLLFLPPASAA